MKKKQIAFLTVGVFVAVILFVTLYHLNLSFLLTGHFEGSDRSSYSVTYYDQTDANEKASLEIHSYNPFTKEVQGSFQYSVSGSYTYYSRGKWHTDYYQESHKNHSFETQLDRKTLSISVKCDSGRTFQLNFDIDYGNWVCRNINLYCH